MVFIKEKNIALAYKIEKKLDEQHITQSELSRIMGTNRADISLTLKNLRAGKSITTSKLFKILDVLNIKFDYLDK